MCVFIAIHITIYVGKWTKLIFLLISLYVALLIIINNLKQKMNLNIYIAYNNDTATDGICIYFLGESNCIKKKKLINIFFTK